MVIVTVQGGKGGILKTGTTELLCAWLDDKQMTWRGADTDQENKSFYAAHSSVESATNVQRFDVYDRTAGRLRVDEVDGLVNDIDKARHDNVDVYVIDQGAGQGNVLRGAFSETGMLDEIREGRIKLTILFVTVNTDAALSTLEANLRDTFADVPCEWIIAKNEFKGSIDSVFTADEQLMKAVNARKARFVTIPLVPDSGAPLTAFENSRKPLREFVKVGPFAVRGRLHTWMRLVHQEFDRVNSAFAETDKVKVTPRSARAATKWPADVPPVSEVG